MITNMIERFKKRREYWVREIAKLSGSFSDDSFRIVQELQSEIEKEGYEALLDHLRICGVVPEHYPHDSSEEKLYSKYTDALLSESFTALGLKSTIISARADAADVQARARSFSLVADAKAFRLSRTAKNQKDFKVQAMDGWRNGLDFAVLICPIYQLPTRTSQIYQQAIARNVCIFSYSHLATLVGLAVRSGKGIAEKGFHNLLKIVATLHPSKSAVDYWNAVNGALLNSLKQHNDLWKTEKTLSFEALSFAKDEALRHLRSEKDRLLGLSHRKALEELIRLAGLDSRITQVQNVEHGDLLEE